MINSQPLKIKFKKSFFIDKLWDPQLECLAILVQQMAQFLKQLTDIYAGGKL